MHSFERTVGAIRAFIEEQLDKMNMRYGIQKTIAREDVDRYISGNPYFHAELLKELKCACDNKILEEKYDGYVEEIYHNIVVWVSTD